MEVQTAERHERQYPPISQQRIYRTLCWILGPAFYFSFLINFPHRLDAMIAIGSALVVVQFFSGAAKPMETAMKSLMREHIDKDALPVWITVNPGDERSVSDKGALYADGGWLIFKGLETEFRIPITADIQLKEARWPVCWLIEFNTPNGPIKIDICKTYCKPQVKDLTRKLDDLLRRWEQNEPMPTNTVAILPAPASDDATKNPDSRFKWSFNYLYYGGLAVLCLAIWFFPDQLAYRLEKPMILMLLGPTIGQWFIKNGDREIHLKFWSTRKDPKNANP